jgi:hypothetical protein
MDGQMRPRRDLITAKRSPRCQRPRCGLLARAQPHGLVMASLPALSGRARRGLVACAQPMAALWPRQRAQLTTASWPPQLRSAHGLIVALFATLCH